MSEGLFAGKYRLVEEIGRGGMGTVHRALQIELDREVALKVLHPSDDGASGDEDRERMMREARTCARLRHPHIVEIYDVGEWEGRVFIAMERVEGQDLHRLLKRGLPKAAAVELLAQVASALQCAHDAGVVHRDLKPENVLIDGAGRAKVVDWGLAQSREASRRLTRTGIIMGTPSYMAPEQIRSQGVTGASDLYALGVMLYEVLSGHLPFEDASVAAVLMGHLKGEVPPLVPRDGGLSDALEGLAFELLAKDPAERPRGGDEVAARLRSPASLPSRDEEGRAGRARRASRDGARATRLMTASPPASDPKERDAVERRRWTGAAVAAGLLVLLVVALGLRRFVGTSSPSGEGGASSPTVFVVREALIDEQGRLELRHQGDAPESLPWRLVVDGEGEVGMGLLRSGRFRAAEGHPISQAVRGWRMELLHPPVEDGILSLEGTGHDAVPVSARSYVSAGTAFLGDLGARRLERFIAALVELRRSHKAAEIGDRLPRLFAAHGFEGASFERLRSFLDRLVPRQILAKSPLARRLLPLARIEGHLCRPAGHRLPWRSFAELLDLNARSMHRGELLDEWYGKRLLSFHTMEASRPNPHKRSLLWLHTSEQLARFREDPEAYITITNTLSFAMRGMRATEADWFEEGSMDLPIEAAWLAQGAKPPRMLLALSWFLQRICLEMTINGSEPYRFVNVAPHFAEAGSAMRESRWLFDLPVDRRDLRVGANELRFRVRLLGGELPIHGTAVQGVGLVRAP